MEAQLPSVSKEDQPADTHASPLPSVTGTPTAPPDAAATAPAAGIESVTRETFTTHTASTEAGTPPNDPDAAAVIPVPGNWLMGLLVNPTQS